MKDQDRVFDALQNCVAEPKCRDCPWIECESFEEKHIKIPISLGLAICRWMHEQYEEIKPVLCGTMWECGACGSPVGIYMDDQRDDYCRKCGKKVLWNESV